MDRQHEKSSSKDSSPRRRRESGLRDGLKTMPFVNRVDINTELFAAFDSGDVDGRTVTCLKNVGAEVNADKESPSHQIQPLSSQHDHGHHHNPQEHKSSLRNYQNQSSDNHLGQNPNTAFNANSLNATPQCSADDEVSEVELKPLHNLRAIEILLLKVFKGSTLSIDEFALSTPELHILVEILIRKNKSSSKNK